MSGEGLLFPGVRGISFMVDSVDANFAAMGDAGRDYLWSPGF